MLQRLLILVLFLVGLFIFMYPFVNQVMSDYLDQQTVQRYQERVSKQNQQLITEMQEEMTLRNQQVEREQNPGADGEPFSEEQREQDQEEAATPGYFDRHTIGVLSIPQLQLQLPIFDKTSELFLANGASLLEGTSTLSGGESTHAVLSSHRGMKDAKLFTDLPKLVEEDVFFIEVFDEIHAYEVDQIKTVEPHETEALLVIDGEDHVTLLTCTPYGINSHRLLVRGRRIDYDDSSAVSAVQEVTKKKQQHMQLWLLAAAIGSLILLAIIGRIVRQGIASRRHYTFSFRIVDACSGLPLEKIVFELYTRKGQQPIQLAGEVMQGVSDEAGVVQIRQLPGASYRIQAKNRETATLFFVTVKSLGKASLSLSNGRSWQGIHTVKHADASLPVLELKNS